MGYVRGSKEDGVCSGLDACIPSSTSLTADVAHKMYMYICTYRDFIED